eukprot:619738-Amphidinium_carterae.1
MGFCSGGRLPARSTRRSWLLVWLESGSYSSQIAGAASGRTSSKAASPEAARSEAPVRLKQLLAVCCSQNGSALGGTCYERLEPETAEECWPPKMFDDAPIENDPCMNYSVQKGQYPELAGWSLV